MNSPLQFHLHMAKSHMSNLMCQIRPRMIGRLLLYTITATLALFALLWFALPFPAQHLDGYPSAVQLLDRSGQPLGIVLGGREALCYPVALADSGTWTWKALVASEDKRFFDHHGVDPLAVLRALALDARRHRVVSGASTISMQVIRLMQPRHRTLVAKCIETFRALQLERLRSKDQILEQYLNRAPFGANIAGVEAASQRYFGTHARDLTLAESALLVGALPAPTAFRPDKHLDRARQQMQCVLDRMRTCGYISDAQMAIALAQPLAVKQCRTTTTALHFRDMLRGTLAQEMWRRAGTNARVRTTLDLRMQSIAEAALASHAQGLRAQHVFGGAVVVLDVRSGGIRAMVGSPNPADVAHAGQVNAALALRSPGSALKPFAYALAFDCGMLTPAAVLGDVPMRFPGYQPHNLDGEFTGLVSARDALVRSLNMPALSVARQVGIEPFTASLRNLGLSTISKPASHYGLSIVLGTVEVRPLDVATAYACLARGGSWMPCSAFADAPTAITRRIVSPEAAWMVADVLADDERVRAYTGCGADAQRPRVALKTGTSSGKRDAWAVIYNPEYVVAVWLGNPDGAPADCLAGLDAAAPLAYDVFRQLYPAGAAPWFDKPGGIRTRAVCAVSGRPAGPHCPSVIDDCCIAGVSDPTPCAIHQLRPFDATTGTPLSLAAAGTVKTDWKVEEIWPREITAFLRRTAVTNTAANATMRIVSPAPGGTYCLLHGNDAQSDTLILRATGGNNGRYWFVDNRMIGRCESDDTLTWRLEQGKHTIACADQAGNAAATTIAVE